MYQSLPYFTPRIYIIHYTIYLLSYFYVTGLQIFLAISPFPISFPFYYFSFPLDHSPSVATHISLLGGKMATSISYNDCTLVNYFLLVTVILIYNLKAASIVLGNLMLNKYYIHFLIYCLFSYYLGC